MRREGHACAYDLDGATAPAYMVRNGVTYRIITDNQGSVRLVVDAETGEVMQRLDYDSFGRVLRDTNPGFQPFGFQGGLYDPDTGLVEFGCRWYDAYTGRWISKDPIGLEGGINLYEFCEDNPVAFQDPSGLVHLNLFPPLERISEQADGHNPSGVFSVGGHGDATGIAWPFRDQAPSPRIPAETLANRIRNDPRFHGQPVQLDACNVGNGSYPQELANLLGVEVRAPNRYACYISRGGRVTVEYHGLIRRVENGRVVDERINWNDRGQLKSFFPIRPIQTGNQGK